MRKGFTIYLLTVAAGVLHAQNGHEWRRGGIYCNSGHASGSSAVAKMLPTRNEHTFAIILWVYWT